MYWSGFSLLRTRGRYLLMDRVRGESWEMPFPLLAILLVVVALVVLFALFVIMRRWV
jgi:hypothetical protein